ncbi:MAG: 2OG-Fe(II) oxygenase [Cryobacterium sp.]|nr:2OG-Fe(II) oxygenase [Oligoflexia bacterium]
MKEPQRVDQAVSDLEHQGYCILEGALSAEFCVRIRADIERLRDSGLFAQARIGKAASHQTNLEIRRDETYWLNEGAPSPVQKELLETVERYREGFNRHFFSGLWELEGHFGIYSPGAFYLPHLDQFQNDSRRTVSVVAFFNPDWKVGEGGFLRLHLPERKIDVLPNEGTLVFFFSDRILHEVTETHRERLSFAGWFLQRPR